MMLYDTQKKQDAPLPPKTPMPVRTRLEESDHKDHDESVVFYDDPEGRRETKRLLERLEAGAERSVLSGDGTLVGEDGRKRLRRDDDIYAGYGAASGRRGGDVRY